MARESIRRYRVEPNIPPDQNGRYTLGRLTEAVGRIGTDIKYIREDVRSLSDRLAVVEKHIDVYPGRFITADGPVVKELQETVTWAAAMRAKSSVILGVFLAIWAVAQGVAVYVIAQWITHTFDLTMIKR